MKIIKSINECFSYSLEQKNANHRVSLVPTMGNLHNGHLSLIELAKRHSDRVIVSVFVNPLQFSEDEDFDTYPRTLESDLQLAESAGADIVFCPLKDQLNTESISTQVYVPDLGKIHCGVSRPHFFQGVCSIVLRLFNIVQPNVAVFGEKDFQQLTIIRRMVSDLFFPVDILSGPIVREKNGLAMSSRNRYLSDFQKQQASFIFEMLNNGISQFEAGETDAFTLIQHMTAYLQESAKEITIDYLDIVENEHLRSVSNINPNDRILFAGYLDGCRLIDNASF